MNNTYHFSFPSFIRDEFDTKFNRLNKKLKAMRDGEEVQIVKESFEDRRILKPEARKKVMNTRCSSKPYQPKKEDYLNVVFTTVEVSIPSVNKIEGYTFAGTINIKGDVKTIFSVDDNVNLSEVDVKICHHCNTRRKRTRLHVFTELATGDHKAIGSTCVHEYLGIDIDKVLNTFFNFYKEDDFYGSRGMTKAWGYPIEQLANATRLVYHINPTYTKAQDSYGYYNENATKNVVDRYHTIMYNPSPYDLPQQAKAMEMLKSAPKVGNLLIETYGDLDEKASNFNSNVVQTLFYDNGKEKILRDFIVGKSRGIFVWAVFNALNKKVTVSDADSDYVGKVGDKINFQGKVTFVKDCESYYGSIKMVKLQDKDGNLFVTFGNGKTLYEAKIGDEVTVNATVTKHEEFKGIKQTRLKMVVLS
jgi:hypothetical protein